MPHIKVGDRVKVVNDRLFNDINLGREGVVTQFLDSARTEVEFGDGSLDYGYPSDLELITPAAPAIPDEIEINGAKYRRVIEEAVPEKPEPKAGQVWRDTSDGSLLIATDESGNSGPESLLISGSSYGVITYGRLGGSYFTNCEFIAPSLADALERGLITAADLR